MQQIKINSNSNGSNTKTNELILQELNSSSKKQLSEIKSSEDKLKIEALTNSQTSILGMTKEVTELKEEIEALKEVMK